MPITSLVNLTIGVYMNFTKKAAAIATGTILSFGVASADEPAAKDFRIIKEGASVICIGKPDEIFTGNVLQVDEKANQVIFSDVYILEKSKTPKGIKAKSKEAIKHRMNILEEYLAAYKDDAKKMLRLELKDNNNQSLTSSFLNCITDPHGDMARPAINSTLTDY